MSQDAAAPQRSLSYDDLRQIELRLFHNIQRLRDSAQHLRLDAIVLLDNLLTLVEGNRFAIAVVGEFKRGKSTFINALLGDEVLPAAIEACSATLNRVTFGWEKRARVVFRGNGPREERIEEVPIEQLADYVTKLTPEATQMSAKVEEAIITYPTHFCKNNVDIIDTPGLNDDDVMTDITLAVVARVNAAIMVIRANIPFGDSEKQFLVKILDEDIRSVLFVVTAIDEIAPLDRPRLLKNIGGRIQRTVEQYAADLYDEDSVEYQQFMARAGAPQVFGLSGYQALQARRARDANLEVASGFPTFTAALEALLAEKDGVAHVLQIVERMTTACRQMLHDIDASQATVRVRLASYDALYQRASLGFDDLHGRIHTALRRSEGNTSAARLSFEELRAQVTMVLKIAAAAVAQEASLTMRDLAAAVREIVESPQPPVAINPAVHTWLAGLPDLSAAIERRFVGQLQPQVRSAIQDAWRAHIDMLAQRIEKAWDEVSTPLIELAVALDRQTHDALRASEAFWPDRPPPAPELAPQLSQLRETARHTLGAQAQAAGAANLVDLTLLPQLVALRLATRIATGQFVVSAPNRTPVEDFKSACIKSFASDIDQAGIACDARLQDLVDRCFNDPFAEFHRLVAQHSDPAHGRAGELVTQLQRQRKHVELGVELELQDLDRRRREIQVILDECLRTMTQLPSPSSAASVPT